MLSALILQKILGIPTVSLLIIFLSLSKEAQEFCGLKAVPGNYYFSRFKKDYAHELENLFNRLVDVTEPICQKIDPELAFDTSGIEAYVTERIILNSTIQSSGN